MKPNRNRIGGFTLIELMIAVIIVGILAAIALPSYRSYVIKGSRAAAQSELLRMAALQEKIYLNSNAYTVSLVSVYNGTTSGGLGITSGMTTDGKYSITCNIAPNTPCTAPSQTYTLTATPVAGTTQAGDGNITISENDQRCWYVSGAATCTPW